MQRHLTRRLLVVAGIAAGAVGLLALASYVTTQQDWEGGFPKGEFRVTVRDPEGRPVPGAVVRGYFAQTGLPVDADGRVTLTEVRGPLQFGGHQWHLFWAIPVGKRPPDYVWEVTADGYRPRRVESSKVYAAPRPSREPTTTYRDGDRTVELPVYELTVTMDR
jgi:hypothetical protein